MLRNAQGKCNFQWQVVQDELMPELKSKVGSLTRELEKMVHTLEWHCQLAAIVI